MQIIESSVSLFSTGLIVFMVLSYLLFKVKNRSISFPGQKKLYSTQVSIIYEQPSEVIKDEPVKNDYSKRFIVINDVTGQPPADIIRKKRITNNRFYVYKPGPNKIVQGLEFSKIKQF
ncbi:MAG TPA: hypothetical protein VLB50_10385 [Ignavibacteriaceae bacterium]|nr:hypothetical protein [Ignavibacteriaceae bacterium]